MKRIISTNDAPAAIGPYNQAIEVNGMVFTSGQLPINPSTGTIESDDITEQTEQVFKNLEAVLAAAECNLSYIVKCTVFLSDISNFKAMNEVYAKYLGDNSPARSAFAVKDLPMGALVEIEAVAVK